MLTGHHTEQRALAGAIGADQRGKLARRKREAHAVNGTHAVEVLAYIVDNKQTHRGAAGRSRRARRKPAIPCGNTTTSSTIATPSTRRQ
jgi:hypothetical protein